MNVYIFDYSCGGIFKMVIPSGLDCSEIEELIDEKGFCLADIYYMVTDEDLTIEEI